MKRVNSLLAIMLTLAMSLCACGSKETPVQEKQPAETEVVETEEENEKEQTVEEDNDSSDEEIKDAEESEETEVDSNQQEAEEIDDNGIQQFIDGIGDEDFADQIIEILHADIGFTNIEYTGVLEGTANYQFNADGKDIIVTAFADDGYVRIFEPHGNVYYEDGEILLTYEDEKENSINWSDAITYYIMAQEIVTERMKNPGSANFPGINSGYVGFGKKDDVILVTGYVEGQNDLGATVRENYIAEFIPVDMDEYNYETVYVKVGDYSEGEFVEIP